MISCFLAKYLLKVNTTDANIQEFYNPSQNILKQSLLLPQVKRN